MVETSSSCDADGPCRTSPFERDFVVFFESCFEDIYISVVVSRQLQ